MSVQNSYDSIAAAAAGMGIPKRDLRRAKKEGAPGFRGSRVYPAELVPWLKAKEVQAISTPAAAKSDPAAGDKEGWEARRIRLQCEKAELELEEKRGALWDSNQVCTSWMAHLRATNQALDILRTSTAPLIAGRSAVECERILGEQIEKVRAKLRGNPYGEGPAACTKCGAALEYILKETVKPVPVVVKGKEKAGSRKAARHSSKQKGKK